MEIGRILHLKFETRNLRLDWPVSAVVVQFEISSFEFEMQDSSNFQISSPLPSPRLRHDINQSGLSSLHRRNSSPQRGPKILRV